jgi:hypothetical protein
MRSLTALACALALAIPSTSPAQSRVRGVGRLGAEFGGEKVLQFTYDDGSTPDVPAGGGLLLAGGGVIEAFRAERFSVEAQLTAGLKFRTIPPATNQEATWLRFPVEALAFVKPTPRVRIGGGVTMHFANKLKASGAVLNDEVTFKASPGFVAQAEYLHKNFGFDLRFTKLDYEIDRGGSGTIDASSIGAGMTFFFGPKPAG